MTDYAIGYVSKDDGKVTIHYAQYATFNESKNALLAMMSTTGLELMSTYPPTDFKARREVREIAQATLELLTATEDVFSLDPEQNILSYGTAHMLVFIKPGDMSDLKEEMKLADDLDITFELIADHRKCTQDFCYSTIETSLN